MFYKNIILKNNMTPETAYYGVATVLRSYCWKLLCEIQLATTSAVIDR